MKQYPYQGVNKGDFGNKSDSAGEMPAKFCSVPAPFFLQKIATRIYVFDPVSLFEI
ncbi:hypothetical protein HMPREF9374_0319 [Desmospora sp. 8437]|nr:hypothetical protein HMPREF9374_0319 [Desmospora sp. 8437]